MTTSHNFATTWDYVNPDQGHTTGGCHPVPLRPPYVLWDTRNFVPSEHSVKTGGVYPGPLSIPTRIFGSTSNGMEVYLGPLHNEGTGGSVFDLHVYYDPPSSAQSIGRMSAAKYYNHFALFESLGTEWPLSWDDYEGEPCEAPFTVIYGIGHIGRNEQWGTSNDHEWNDPQIYWDNGYFFLDFIDEILGPIYDSFSGLYLDAYNFALDFYPSEPDFFGDYPQLNNEIVTITSDPRCREINVWVGTKLMVSASAGWEGDNIYRYFDSGPCETWENADDSVTNDIYIEMYGHDSAAYNATATDYEPTAWSGIVGVAKFRGSPSFEDLLYWQEYFRAGAPQAEGFSETTVAVGDTEEIYPNPYRYRYTGAVQTYTVPCGVNNIRISCWGGGRTNDGRGGAGGLAEAEFAVTPGQVFDVYVGDGNVGTSAGWPNGGQSTNGNNNEGQAGSGSSHVIPQGGAFTDALVVGGGGGGVNEMGGSRSTPGTLVFAGSGGYPAGSDGNGVGGPDDGIEWGGRGGTQVAGGAVGVTTGGGGVGEAGDTDGQGQGGDATGSGNFFAFGAGSGGGGWHGGGSAGGYRTFGGGSYAGDGGGGSSYVTSTGSSNVNYSNGVWYGDGMVEILALEDPEDIGC